MGRRKFLSILLTAVFALSAVMTGTLGWQSISQSAQNELGSSMERPVETELLKLEKLPDGTETDRPVPGASFYLFTAEGEQIGGLYHTDENGKTYPLLAFSFTYTATQADGSQVKGSFTDNYYLDE